MSIERSDVSALAFTSQQDYSRALSLLSYSVFSLELSTAGETILVRHRSVMASLDPVGMIMNPSGITFLGPVGVFRRIQGARLSTSKSERYQPLSARSSTAIAFLGLVVIFSMSPPNFNYNWSRLEYHGDSNFLLCILCICIVSSSFYELCHSPCYAYYASE